MCLERCEEDVEHSMNQLLSLGHSTIPWVSFEAFDLDYRGTVVDIGLSHVGPKLKAAGFTLYPMITSTNTVNTPLTAKESKNFRSSQ